jgi:hypothetical protein
MYGSIKNLLPTKPGKWILWIVVAIGLYIAYRLISKEIKKAKYKRSLTSETAETQIITSSLSYSEAEYSIMAERLYGAFNRWVGYNFDTVRTVLQSLKTSSDFYKLVTVYGIRDISPTSWINQNFGLIQTFEDQLSDNEMEEVSGILKQINVNF